MKLFIYSKLDPSEDEYLQKSSYDVINERQSLNGISIFKILFRTIRVYGCPEKVECKSKFERLKRTLLRTFRLDIQKTIVTEIVLFRKEHALTVYNTFTNFNQLYSFHIPQAEVITAKQFGRDTSKYKKAVNKILASQPNFKDNSEGTTIFINGLCETLLKAYRKTHPNRKVIVRIVDGLYRGHNKFTEHSPVALKQHFKNLIDTKVVNSYETYDKQEAMLLDIAYRPNFVNPDALRKLATSYIDYCYVFLGVNSSNDRLAAFYPIKKKLLELYPSIAKYSYEQIIDGSTKFLPYVDYLKLVVKSEIVLDMFKLEQDEGYSFRIAEALFLRKKVITNRVSIKNESFYDPSRFFLIGIDSLDRLKGFMESEYKCLDDSEISEFNANLL